MAEMVADQLTSIKDDIIKLFQMSIYSLYGVLYDAKNITYIDEPDFSFEEPSLAEKIQTVTSPVQSVVESLMDSTAKQMADVEAKYNKDKGKKE